MVQECKFYVLGIWGNFGCRAWGLRMQESCLFLLLKDPGVPQSVWDLLFLIEG